MPYSGGTFTLLDNFGTGTFPDNAFPNKVGDVLADIAAGLSISTLGTNGVLLAVNNLSDVGSVAAARNNLIVATRPQTDFISGGIASATAKDYRVIEYMPYSAVLTRFTTKTTSGTLLATLKVGTVAVTNGVATVTSAQSSVIPSGANTVAAASALVITMSSIVAPVDLSFTVVFTRTLD